MFAQNIDSALSALILYNKFPLSLGNIKAPLEYLCKYAILIGLDIFLQLVVSSEDCNEPFIF